MTYGFVAKEKLCCSFFASTPSTSFRMGACKRPAASEAFSKGSKKTKAESELNDASLQLVAAAAEEGLN